MRSQVTVVKYVESGGTDYKPCSKKALVPTDRASSAALVSSAFGGDGGERKKRRAEAEGAVMYCTQLRVTLTGVERVKVVLVDGGRERGVDTYQSDELSDAEGSHGATFDSDSELEDEAVVAKAAPLGGGPAAAPTNTRKRKRAQSSVGGDQGEGGDGGEGGGGAPAAASEGVFISPLRSEYVGVSKHGNGYAWYRELVAPFTS